MNGVKATHRLHQFSPGLSHFSTNVLPKAKVPLICLHLQYLHNQQVHKQKLFEYTNSHVTHTQCSINVIVAFVCECEEDLQSAFILTLLFVSFICSELGLGALS